MRHLKRKASCGRKDCSNEKNRRETAAFAYNQPAAETVAG